MLIPDQFYDIQVSVESMPALSEAQHLPLPHSVVEQAGNPLKAFELDVEEIHSLIVAYPV